MQRNEAGSDARIGKALLVLCLHDGRAGHRAQCLGLGEALARRLGIEIGERCAAPRRGAAFLPARAWHGLSGLWPGWPAAGLADPDAASAPPEGTRLIVGAGRRAAPVVAALGRRHGTPTVQLMNPRMDPAAFDLVAAPAHDRLAATNVVATVGALGRVDATTIATAAEALPPETRAAIEALAPPRLAVLIGGPSASARWDETDSDRLVAALAGLARGGRSLVATASRRTDPALVARLRAACPAERLWLWADGPGANPYPGLLALADAALVTEDSVSMASEAAAAGLAVHTFRLARIKPRLRAFHRALEEHGAARPFDGRIERWSYPPLAEADRVAALVAEWLLPDLAARPRATRG